MDTTQNYLSQESPRGGGLAAQGQNFVVQENTANAVRRKVPERVVNSKGSGLYGKFTVTADISDLTSSTLFAQTGNQCKIFVRFSSMNGEKGSSDNQRDVRGFAVKFYTEEGNWDLVGTNMPVYFLKDPQHFSELMQSQGKNPQTNLRDAAQMWDFYSAHPQTLHQLLMLMSERGKPAGFPHMHGFGSHTFSMINEKNERTWVKFHLKTKQTIKNITDSENFSPDFAQEDLVDAIQNHEFPQWTIYIQTMSVEQAKKYRWNPFDVTKVWLQDEFPLIEVGILELNQLPDNYFSHVEQATFSPANIIPGLGFSPDRMLQARLLSYADAHRHRVGSHFKDLEVNRNLGAADTAAHFESEIKTSSIMAVNAYDNEDDHYTQPGLFYTLALDDSGRASLIDNVVSEMQKISGPNRDAVINRQLCHFFRANIELGMKIAMGLQINIDANMMSHTMRTEF